MGIIVRQTLKSTGVYYIAAIFGVINRLFLLPKYLTASEIGFLDNFTYLAVILSTLAMLGSSGTLVKFHQYYRNKNSYPNLLGWVFKVSLMGVIVFSCLFFLIKKLIINAFQEDFELLDKFYYLIPVLALVMVLRSVFQSYSIIQKRVTVPTILNDLWNKVATLFLLILIGYNIINLYTYIHLLIFLYLIATLILIVYTIKILKFKLSFKTKEKQKNKEVLKYSLFLLLSGFSGYITQYADSLMLGSYQGFDSSGVYSIAFFIGISIEMPKRALSRISSPIIASHFEEKKWDEINVLYKKSSINQGIIGLFLYLLIYINIDYIFQLIPNHEVYEIGKYVTLIIGASKVIDMFMGVNSEILLTSKYYYLDLNFMILFIVITVGSNYILIPKYEINGAAIATLISITFYNIIRFTLLKKTYNFSPFSLDSLKLLTLFIILLGINFLIPQLNLFTPPLLMLTIAIKSLIFGIIFIFTCYKLNISEEFNSLINFMLNKIKLRK